MAILNLSIFLTASSQRCIEISETKRKQQQQQLQSVISLEVLRYLYCTVAAQIKCPDGASAVPGTSQTMQSETRRHPIAGFIC